MNIELVRILDYYVGIPLCLLGSVARKISGLFQLKQHRTTPGNILFIELSEMGSVVLADPAMTKVRRELNASLFFAIFRKNCESLELLGSIPRDNIFIMDDSSVFTVALESFRFMLWTRRKRIDTVIDLELFSRFTALLTGFSGAGNRVGFHPFFNEGLYRGDFLTHKVAFNPHLHIAKNFIALVNALLIEPAEINYSKTFISDSELSLRRPAILPGCRQKMLTKIDACYPGFDPELHRLIIFNCNSSDLIPLRRWPKEYYVSLAQTILEKHPHISILLTGTTSEYSDKLSIVEAVESERCINFAGETALTELPALYSLCEFMLTNDSGPAHFAAVTDMPVYVFFGPETPNIYGPLGCMTPIYSGLACSPCVSATNHRKSACTDNICLQLITPDQVYAVLQPALERSVRVTG